MASESKRSRRASPQAMAVDIPGIVVPLPDDNIPAALAAPVRKSAPRPPSARTKPIETVAEPVEIAVDGGEKLVEKTAAIAETAAAPARDVAAAVVEQAPAMADAAIHTATDALTDTTDAIVAHTTDAIDAVQDAVAAEAATTIQDTATAAQTQQEKTIMETMQTATDKTQAMFADANDRAKGAVEKGAKFFQEITEFGKGNVEAVVESSKIAAKGFESMGQDTAAYLKTSFEDATQAFRTLATIKSPTELMKFQSDYLRSAFDAMVAQTSRGTEASLKLAGEVAQPISNRVAVAAEKIKIAA